MNSVLPQTISRGVKTWLQPTCHYIHSGPVIATQSNSTETTQSALLATPLPSSDSTPNTHFKITLLRSAIGLGERKKGTLLALGIHRRMQTVYHPHSPECAGKILAVKELVRVENVPAHAVRTKTEQRRERRAPRGYSIVKRLDDLGLDVS